ncbi:cell wall metabolism sensor histidine kinase WalK [Streptacidiphilus sp. P02-A3a]|uniref:sensor histidine kinase n=1 Tax=Streptacidiphilus sp. P02-A3a TaxID=2704468 RepID=UPI0015FC3669|nr:HAMP domain-containing sensor histidine kinase [Streptacidiphilus sp. P02-A3a]QMU67853.1 HAMP domain-containing histidine kinase [Streptacidiphilus sp. P02-A3a]
MNSYLVMAAYAAAGAAAAGLLGWPVIVLLRRRSLALALFTVAFVTALSLSASTIAVARAMLLMRHDYAVVTIVLAMGCLVSLIVAALLSRQVVAGSRALTQAARTVGSDAGFTAPARPLSSELSALSAELAATSARLAQSRERERALEASRRELIAWMSHDLRTPLAGLRAMAEALEDGVAEDPPRYHSRIRTEVDRLTGMVDDLFELSRIQAGALTLTLSRVSVYDLVGDAIAGAHPLARERGVHLVGDRVAPAPVEVDSREITRVLGNLLINAIRSTPVDGTVAVAARREAGQVVVSVTDGCGGIDEQDLARVFETGWRGGSARTPRSPATAPAGAVQHHGDTGAGLGLAIVRGIVEAHAGRASVRNVGGGCCFEIALPAAAPTA